MPASSPIRSMPRQLSSLLRVAVRSSSQTPFARGTARRSYATGESGPNPRPGKSPFSVWPFVAITLAGSGAYVLMVKQRANMTPPPLDGADSDNTLLPAPHKDTPTFSPSAVTVVFVLGGPGAGKGTQCANLVRDYGFIHLSAGDLLRAEQDRAGSQFGELIRGIIKEGSIVPMEITVQLLENAMTEAINNKKKKEAEDQDGITGTARFLIDGFPRKMDQAVRFEQAVCPARFVLFFDCPEAEMERRLLRRGETSGRADDNAESIKKRFRTFVETSMPVVDRFDAQGRVVKVAATRSPDDVYAETRRKIEGRLAAVEDTRS